MEMKKNLLSLKQMESIAREATAKALGEYPEPAKEKQAQWVLGRYETEDEGIFEIYIPHEIPSNAEVISRARVDRRTGAVTVDVFLKK